MSSPLAPPRGQPPEAVRLPRSHRMKDLPAELRPRERLLSEVRAGLSIGELVAVLLRTGSRRRSALEVATELLCRHGSLERLAAASPAELCRTPGMGQVKALNLLAAIELGRRLRVLPPTVRPTIRAPAEVAALTMGDLRFQGIDHFWVLLFNPTTEVLARTEHAGGDDATGVRREPERSEEEA